MSASVSVSVSTLVDTLDKKATESIEDVSVSACVSESADAHVDTLLFFKQCIHKCVRAHASALVL